VHLQVLLPAEAGVDALVGARASDVSCMSSPRTEPVLPPHSTHPHAAVLRGGQTDR
jgi:hypothetical protein